MYYIKYLLATLYYLIVNNPVKIISLILAIVFFQIAGTFGEAVKEIKVIKEINEGSKWLYLYQNSSGYFIHDSDKKQEISEDGYVYEYYYNPINVIFWTLFVVASLFVFIPTFSQDSDINWEIGDAREDALLTLVTCELDGGKYHYIAAGRLLAISNDRITRSLNHNLNLHKFRDIMLCPEFKTKSKDRGLKLDKLGIK